ncbi:hypothetical protein L3Q82_025562 [Scortum barcoo]|uniref:Uncharacterized protein n=1 Tax=Scortum barcoo TaxID=214431 RepID=A0ACB8WL74_9TELE|nr:hypothetical protein L3Q82_025562 [Scortum barcoo]
MGPADQEPRSAPVQQAVTQQGILLGQHDANIRALISAKNSRPAGRFTLSSARLPASSGSPEDQGTSLRLETISSGTFKRCPPNRSQAEENFIVTGSRAGWHSPGAAGDPDPATPCSGRPNPGSGEAPTPHSPLIEPVDLSGVPPTYHDLQEVFNKDKALSLPPHRRPMIVRLKLLPDAPSSSSRLYNLTRPEQEAMEGYINDSELLASSAPQHLQ